MQMEIMVSTIRQTQNITSFLSEPRFKMICVYVFVGRNGLLKGRKILKEVENKITEYMWQ